MTWFFEPDFICLNCRLRRIMQVGRTDDKQEPYIRVICEGFDFPTYFFDNSTYCAEFKPKEAE